MSHSECEQGGALPSAGAIFMTYERFSKLWDALVTNRPKAPFAVRLRSFREKMAGYTEPGMRPRTAAALIAYGQGDKSAIQKFS